MYCASVLYMIDMETITSSDKLPIHAVVRPLTVYLYQAFPESVKRGILVSHLFQRTADEGLLERTMPGATSLGEFAPLIDKPSTAISFVRDGETQDCVGYGSLFEISGPVGKRRASVVYCFFKRWQATRQMLEAALRTTEAWFRDWGVSTLYGSILNTNSQALKFSETFGFTEIGSAPNFYPGIGDGHIVVLTKEWFERRWLETLKRIKRDGG